MPKCRVELLAAAWRDVDKIAGFHLEKVGVDSAQRITDKILDRVENLAEFPLMGPPHPDPELAVQGYRKLVLTKIYVAVYCVIDNVVFVYRIVNGTTDYPKLLK